MRHSRHRQLAARIRLRRSHELTDMLDTLQPSRDWDAVPTENAGPVVGVDVVVTPRYASSHDGRPPLARPDPPRFAAIPGHPAHRAARATTPAARVGARASAASAPHAARPPPLGGGCRVRGRTEVAPGFVDSRALGRSREDTMPKSHRRIRLNIESGLSSSSGRDGARNHSPEVRTLGAMHTELDTTGGIGMPAGGWMA